MEATQHEVVVHPDAEKAMACSGRRRMTLAGDPKSQTSGKGRVNNFLRTNENCHRGDADKATQQYECMSFSIQILLACKGITN